MGLKSETFLSVQGKTTQDKLNQHHPVDSVFSGVFSVFMIT